MKRIVTALALIALSQPLLAEEGVVARVNGTVIRQSQIDQAVKQMTAQGQQDSPELRDRIKDELVARELIVQQAVKDGLDRRDDIRDQLELARANLLVNSYLQTWAGQHPVAEDELKAEYDRLKASLKPVDEFQVRHILVKDEKAAKAVLARLKKGEKFDKLAQTLSEDTGSKVKGGELGWVRGDANLVKPFLEAMVKMKKGETSAAPVKSDFGYHIIRVDDVRKAEPPTFEAVKPELNQFMQRKAIEQMVRDLRAKATIE